MSDARGFSAQIDVEFEGAMDQWRQIIRKIALEALRRVTLKTPVDTGRARGNWFVQIGAEGFEVSTAVDPTGAVTIARGSAVIGTYREVKGFPMISIYNNLPYINRLEHGWSKQAPAGMVVVTVTELTAGI